LVIHYLNGHAEIVTRLQEFGALGVGLSSISRAELYEGVFHSREPDKARQAGKRFCAASNYWGSTTNYENLRS
jgi:hypothetical protein